MLCAKPFRQGVEEFGCGRCKPCRLERKRLWSARLMLEATQHKASFFVTLTYDKEHYPCDGCVSKRDVQLFLKSLRYRMEMLEPPLKLRYYIVGEYGDAPEYRAHYHAVLFGLPETVHLQGRMRGQCDCVVCSSWNKGLVFIGSVTPASAAYVVSYVLKNQKEVRLLKEQGKEEGVWMSRKPGLGAPCVKVIAGALVTPDGEILQNEDSDVPYSIRLEKRKYPLGRYLRKKLREHLGGSTDVSRARAIDTALKEGRVQREIRREHSVNMADQRVSFIKQRRKREAI